MYLFVIRKVDQRKTLFSQWKIENLAWFLEKRFPFILNGKHF
jgi:hypothetical protein